MWRAEDASRHAPDVARFIATVNTQGAFFDRRAPIAVARAPGRLDVMGGIADYSGALVLELPLDVATFVAAQSTDDDRLIVCTRAALSAETEVTISLEALAPGGTPLDYDAARALLAAEPRRRWAAYALGALVVLTREHGLPLPRGMRLFVDSHVPVGKGVSSSAALEVAAMKAICGTYGVTLGGRELALLSQMVENRVVGAPCGVMDQMTASLGEKDRLLGLLCQPAEIEAQVVLPRGLEAWGIDSGIRHEVGGADYGDVRVGAFIGYRIIAEVAGLAIRDAGDGRVDVSDPKWRGYLANITAAEWEACYRDAVPLIIDGASFLRRYRGTTDPVTRVNPAARYAVRHPTAHPIYEHRRVQQFRALLEGGAEGEEQRLQLGELMYQSHGSYGLCGLGSSGTDQLVALVRAAGPTVGLYGAKITGGGSGGVVAVLARAGSRSIIDGIAQEYERLTGRSATVLGGSSDGAMRFGVVQLTVDG